VARDTTLLFVTPQCGSCRKLLAGLTHADGSRLVVLCRGDLKTCGRLLDLVPASVPLMADSGGLIASRYGVDSLPAAVLLRDGKVTGHTRPGSLDELKELWTNASVDGVKTQRPSAAAVPSRG
jgi:hypothetical protein